MTRDTVAFPIRFAPMSNSRSPRKRAESPVAMRAQAGALDLELAPLMQVDHLGARASSDTICGDRHCAPDRLFSAAIWS